MNDIAMIGGWVILAIFTIGPIVILTLLYMSRDKTAPKLLQSDKKKKTPVTVPTLQPKSINSNKKRSLVMEKNKKAKISKSDSAENIFASLPQSSERINIPNDFDTPEVTPEPPRGIQPPPPMRIPQNNLPLPPRKPSPENTQNNLPGLPPSLPLPPPKFKN